MSGIIKMSLDVVSALVPAANILKAAFDYHDKVSIAKHRYEDLVERVKHLLQQLSDHIKSGECRPAQYRGNVERLERELQFILDMMKHQADLPVFKLWLRVGEISHHIENASQRLTDCFALFTIRNMRGHLEIKRQVTEASHKDIARMTESCRQLVSMVDHEVLKELEIDESKAEEAMIAMQQGITNMSNDRVEYQVVRHGLNCLQRVTAQKGELRIPDSDWNITSSEIDIDRASPLGRGGSATVYKGQWKGIAVAVKVMIHASSEALHREAKIWSGLRHAHIVQFYGVSTSSPYEPFIVSRYMKNGNLIQYIRQHEDVDRIQLIHEVALGMQFLHDKRIIHGDLKGVNVLIDDTKKACITDFGLSRFRRDVHVCQSGNTSKQIAGTLRWMAPESIKRGIISFHTDVYAFAMLIYETLTGDVPFMGRTDEEIESGDLSLQRPISTEILENGLTDDMWKLLCACSSHEPQERPSFGQISLTTTSLAECHSRSRRVDFVRRNPSILTMSLRRQRHMSESTLLNHDGSDEGQKYKEKLSSPILSQALVMKITATRYCATLKLGRNNLPEVVAHDGTYPSYPIHKSLRSKEAASFHTTARHGVDDEIWSLHSATITRTSPSGQILYNFDRKDGAQRWFKIMRKIAEGKEPKASKLLSTPLTYQQCYSVMRRVVNGVIESADAARATSWKKMPTPVATSVIEEDNSHIIFRATYDDGVSQYSTYALDKDLVRREGNDIDPGRPSSRLVTSQDEVCDTADHAREWYDALRDSVRLVEKR